MIKTIALVGNPNSGKTTVFNVITGSNQHVGNWPGVTVEKKEGSFFHNNIEYNVIDLPGTYSLGAFSEDEVVAKDFIIKGKPDVIIDVVDASNIERNLYLTSQLLEMGQNVVVALNMVDEAQKRAIEFDIDGISKKLGVPVIATVAAREKGIKEVVDQAIKQIDNKKEVKNPVIYKDSVKHHMDHIYEILEGSDLPYPNEWLSLKIVEGDMEIYKAIKAAGLSEEKIKEIDNFYKYHNADNFELEIIDSRYAFAHKVAEGTVIRPDTEVVTLTDKLDRIITNKYLGIPIFALIMLVVFLLTFEVGEGLLGGLAVMIVEWVGGLLEGLLIALKSPTWLVNFFNNGIVNGVGAVIEFVPVITVLYLLLGFLEDSGYMARAAYVWDDLMRKLGMQGKAFISLIIGFGCNVPGVMSARTLDNKKDRMIAILINPFMSCGAKLLIYAVFIAAFFPKYGGLVLFSLYALGIVLGLLVGKIFSQTIFKGESSYFIMELPPYRIPTIKNVLRNMWDNVSGFIKRAGTLIFIVISLLWVLAVLPTSADPYGQTSILGQIGSFIAPIFKPAGFGTWQEAVALFAGIPAKEAVVGTLGMLLDAIQMQFTSLSALSYMVMTLLYTPCVATLGAIGKETKSFKWPLFTALYTFAIGWVFAVLIFQIGTLLGFS